MQTDGRTPIYTNKFQRELEKCKKRGLRIDEIKKVMEILIDEKELDAKHNLHQLSGNYSGFYECHIRPDWLLIFQIDDENNTITFARTGTHSDLFR